MATVTGLTAARMIEMENATVIGGEVNEDGDLILETRDGTLINAGPVIGPTGPAGPSVEVCTSTTRPASPTTGLVIFETDTKLVRIWTGLRWRMQEMVICTSSTHPAMTADDIGVKIYETNTGITYVWNGTAWFMDGSYIVSFTDAAARSAAWVSPPVGALSRLASHLGITWIYESTGWVTVGLRAGTPGLWLGDTAPSDSVFMYGQTIANAQTLYPACWANVASTWKSGTSLLVPDMRDRAVIGKGDMGGTAINRVTAAVSGINSVVLGATGGDQRMQLHNHPYTDPHHDHFMPMYAGYLLGLGEGVGPTNTGSFSGVYGTSSEGVDITIGNTGSGGSQNMPPVIVFNWILKII